MPRVVHVSPSFTSAGGAERLLMAIDTAASTFGWSSLIASPREWLMSSLDTDLVHAHLWGGALAVALKPIGSGKRLLTHHYGDFFEGRALRGGLDRWAARRFDRVVTVSQSSAAYLGGFLRQPVDVIPNGWEMQRQKPLSLPGPVICVARLRPEKGVDVLLSGYGALTTKPGLVIFGDGPEMAILQGLAIRSRDPIDFRGYVDSPLSTLTEASFLVVPSRAEAFGIAVLEGMAAGLPVIGARVGGIPELIQPGVTGELFTPGDHLELARLMEELLADPERCRRMGAAAQKFAQDYTMDKTVERYFQLYEELLSRRN